MGGRVQLPGGEKGTSQRRVFEDGVGGDIKEKAPRGCLRGAKVFWGQLGSPVDRPLCRLREVLLGARPWVGRGEVLAQVGGRPEEVAGPELAPCLTQGLVHPPSLQLRLLG